MDNTGVEQQIRVRCETCRGSGREVAGEGHDFPCFDCNGFGFTKEVFCLKPAPKSLREQLEDNKEQGNG